MLEYCTLNSIAQRLHCSEDTRAAVSSFLLWGVVTACSVDSIYCLYFNTLESHVFVLKLILIYRLLSAYPLKNLLKPYCKKEPLPCVRFFCFNWKWMRKRRRFHSSMNTPPKPHLRLRARKAIFRLYTIIPASDYRRL